MVKIMNVQRTGLRHRRELLIAAFFTCILLINVLYWTVICDSNVFAFLGLLAGFLLGAVIYAYQRGFLDHAPSETVFLAALLTSCVVFVLMFPPLSVPDEGHHYMSSYWLANSITGKTSIFDASTIPLRQDDFLLYSEWSSSEINLQSYRSVISHFELFNHSSEIVLTNSESFSIGSENIATKLGSVLGILIARFFNLGAYPLFYLGRLLNAVQFALLSYAAFKIIPIGKTIISSVSMLPMTLHLAASYSYDGGIIGLSMLLIALILRAIMDNGPISSKETACIAAVLALLAPCKVIYTTISLLLFLIPNSRFQNTRRKYIYIFVLLTMACVSIIGFRLAGIVGLASPSTSLDHRGLESGYFYSLNDVFDDPLGTIALFFRTLLVNGDFYASTLVGGSLGWFQSSIAAPYFLVFVYYLLLLICAQKSKEDDIDVPFSIKIAMLCIFLLCLFGSMVSMFLGWTFNSEPVVMGVQGRYLLPVLTAALIALRWKSIYINQTTFGLVLCSISSINIFYAVGLVGSALSIV